MLIIRPVSHADSAAERAGRGRAGGWGSPPAPPRPRPSPGEEARHASGSAALPIMPTENSDKSNTAARAPTYYYDEHADARPRRAPAPFDGPARATEGLVIKLARRAAASSRSMPLVPIARVIRRDDTACAPPPPAASEAIITLRELLGHSL